MRVFLSWSGEHSHRVALVLKEWLPTVIQALDTWISSSDIEKGESWFSAISESLVKAEGVGVFCLTPDNLLAPWLAYEAGALASQDRGRVATFLHRVQPTELKPPLSLFQATKADSEQDVLLLLQTLNARLSTPLNEARLKKAFDANWLTLSEQLQAIQQSPNPTASVPARNVQDTVEEILNVVKRIEKDSSLGIAKGLGLAGLYTPRPGIIQAAMEGVGVGGLLGDPAIGEQIEAKNKLIQLLRENSSAQKKATSAGIKLPSSTDEA